MALTRKFLSALGIEAEKIDEIITAHSETVEALKEQRDGFKADVAAKDAEIAKIQSNAEKYKADTKKLAAVQQELDDLKADNAENDYKSKFEALQTEYNTYKADTEKAANTAKVTEAFKRDVLAKAGISDKRFDTIMRVTDISKVALDKDGNIKDASKLIESAKTEWADFITQQRTIGANTPTPPNNDGGKPTKESIMAIKDTAERQRTIAQNLDLFSKTTNE